MNFTEIVTAGLMIFTPAMIEAPEDKSVSVKCLALNMYHEARGQGSAGLLAVSSVVMNRVKDKRFPNTICEVVHQGRHDSAGNPIRHKCQFSWYCDGRSDKARDIVAWNVVGMAVQEAVYLFSKGVDLTRGSMYYHTTAVKPFWARRFKRVDQIGVHVFYIRG